MAKPKAGTGEPLQVAPSQIVPEPGQPRQELDQTALASLKESISAEGIRVPLHVMPNDETPGTYRLVAGWRRWVAASELGLKTVPCLLVPHGSFLQRRSHQMIENAQRSDLTPLEQAQSLYILWLSHQIVALSDPQGRSADLDSLIGPDLRPTAQIAILSQRLESLLGTSISAYTQGGTPAVSWSRVLEAVGMGSMNTRERQRLLSVLDLDPALQDELAGKPLNRATAAKLASVAPEEAAALVAAAKDSNDINSTLRAQLDDRAAATPATSRNGSLKETSDAPPLADPDEEEDFGDDEELGTTGYDLNDDAAPRNRPPAAFTLPEPKGKVPPPGRGTPPPQANGWDADAFALLMAGLEGIEQGHQRAQYKQLTETQQRQAQVLWRPVVEALVAAGVSLPRRDGETDTLRWD